MALKHWEDNIKPIPLKFSSAVIPNKLVSKAICPQTHLRTMFCFTVWPGKQIHSKRSRAEKDQMKTSGIAKIAKIAIKPNGLNGQLGLSWEMIAFNMKIILASCENGHWSADWAGKGRVPRTSQEPSSLLAKYIKCKYHTKTIRKSKLSMWLYVVLSWATGETKQQEA